MAGPHVSYLQAEHSPSNGISHSARRAISLVRKHAPDAVESISYGMPAYKTRGKPLVYFASYEHHIGFYATPTGHAHFKKELSKYKRGKGSVQFPLDEPLPYALIAKIVAFRVQENEGTRTKGGG